MNYNYPPPTRKFNMYKKNCKTCGTEFSELFTRAFCSASCRKAARTQTSRKSYKQNSARIIAQSKSYAAKNRIRVQKSQNKYWVERAKKDKVWKLKKRVSNSIYCHIKKRGGVKNGSVTKFLPYSIPHLKAHLESFFNNTNGFTWENHGSVWHIDHIIPQAMFSFTSMDSKEFRDCWALSNLMPVNKHFNLTKGNRFIGTEDSSGQLVFSAPQAL